MDACLRVRSDDQYSRRTRDGKSKRIALCGPTSTRGDEAARVVALKSLRFTRGRQARCSLFPACRPRVKQDRTRRSIRAHLSETRHWPVVVVAAFWKVCRCDSGGAFLRFSGCYQHLVFVGDHRDSVNLLICWWRTCSRGKGRNHSSWELLFSVTFRSGVNELGS